MHNGPSDKDYSLLSLLLKGEEKTVMSVCSRYLESTYGKHNVFCTQDFVYATGDIPILLVSHLDTVLYEPPKTLYTTKDRNIIMGKKGLGADDRAGIFAILKILKAGLRPSVLLTTGEEIGGLGAMSFVKEFPEPPVPTKYVIEIDRRGVGQAVFYECGNAKFMSYVESFGFKTHRGIFSDISFICPHWDVAGVNLSAGYYNEHTEYERLNVSDLFYTIERVINMLNDAENAKLYSFEGINCKDRLYHKCDVCGTQVPIFSMTNVKGTLTCLECVNNFVEWCDICGKPFFTTINKTICEDCADGLQPNSETV